MQENVLMQVTWGKMTRSWSQKSDQDLVLKLACDILWAGHLGVKKTQERAVARLFYLKVY